MRLAPGETVAFPVRALARFPLALLSHVAFNVVELVKGVDPTLVSLSGADQWSSKGCQPMELVQPNLTDIVWAARARASVQSVRSMTSRTLARSIWRARGLIDGVLWQPAGTGSRFSGVKQPSRLSRPVPSGGGSHDPMGQPSR